MRIATPRGFCYLGEPTPTDRPLPVFPVIGPSQTVNVNLPTVPDPGTPKPAASTNTFYGWQAQEEIPSSDLWSVTSDMAVRHSKRIATLLASGRFACVYAQVAGAAPPATLRERGAIERHERFIRVVVPLDTPRGVPVTIVLPPATQPATRPSDGP